MTAGLGGQGGHIYRVFSVDFPVTFAFDFRTGAPADGGWSIEFNDGNPAVSGGAELWLFQVRGALPVIYYYAPTGGGPTGFFGDVVSGQPQDFGLVPAHVSGTVFPDLSSTVTVTYADSTQVVMSTPAPPDAIVAPQGSFLTIGNGNATFGPHYFDNLAVNPTPYLVCPLYDSTKPVKSGATIPIKLQLCNVNGENLSSSAIILSATSLMRVLTSTTGDVQSPGNSNPDHNFRYEAELGGTGGYAFNLKTTGLLSGTYLLNFQVSPGGATLVTPFQVR